jgi:hypothetical protein
LKRCDFDAALTLYYGSARAKGYLDLVVYIDSTGHAFSELLDGRDSVPGTTRGKEYLWILVFSESQPMRLKKDDTTGQPSVLAGFRFARRTVETRQNPALITILGALGKIAGGLGPPNTPTAKPDSVIVDIPDLLGPDDHGSGVAPMYITTGRLGLDQDALASVSVSLDTGATLVGGSNPSAFHSVSAQFLNAAPSLVEVAIGVGGALFRDSVPTFGAATAQSPATRTAYNRPLSPAFFLVTTFNILKPYFPEHRTAVGVSVATNLYPGGLLDDIVLGLTVARPPLPLFGNALGITFGVMSAKESFTDALGIQRTVRRAGTALIVDLRL